MNLGKHLEVVKQIVFFDPDEDAEHEKPESEQVEGKNQGQTQRPTQHILRQNHRNMDRENLEFLQGFDLQIKTRNVDSLDF